MHISYSCRAIYNNSKRKFSYSNKSSKLEYYEGKCHIIVPDNHGLNLAKSILTSLPATTAFCNNGVSAL